MVVHQGLAWALNNRINPEAQTVRPPKQLPFSALAFVLPFHIPSELVCGVALRAAVRAPNDLGYVTFFVWDFKKPTAPHDASTPPDRRQKQVNDFWASRARGVEWDRSRVGGTSGG